MISGFERYIQIARCFRDEDLRADRQPEFTQIDVEMSFPTEEDVFALIEGLCRRVLPLGGMTPPEVFPRLTYAEALARLEQSRPALRLRTPTHSSSRGSAFAASRRRRPRVIEGSPSPDDWGSRGEPEGRRWAGSPTNGAAGVLTLRRWETVFQVKGALRRGRRAVAALRLERGIALPPPRKA
jgi:hypothetical protein